MKKGHHDQVGWGGHAGPAAHQGSCCHGGGKDLRIESHGSQQGNLLFRRLRGIVVEVGAMPHDEQARFGRRDSRGRFPCPLEQDLGHRLMVADRFAVADGFAVATGEGTPQPEVTGNHRLGEITLADEVRNHMDGL